jgi:hypothetical protein
MSDSLPPEESLAPEEERDLEALLSGWPRTVPAGREPVAAALTALRADPEPGELDGEEAALAAFRVFVLPEGSWPARTGGGSPGGPDHPAAPGVLGAPVPAAVPGEAAVPGQAAVAVEATSYDQLAVPAAWNQPDESAAAGAPDLVTVPRPLPATRPPSGPRHRRSRRAGGGRRRTTALAGVGAVLAGLVGLLCVFILPGGSGSGHNPAAASGGTSSGSTTANRPQLQGSGTREPSPSPSVSGSPSAAPGVGQAYLADLCRQWAADANSWPPDHPAENNVLQQLVDALGSRQQAFSYCFSVYDPGQSNPGEGNAGLSQPQPHPGRGPDDNGSTGARGGITANEQGASQ